MLREKSFKPWDIDREGGVHSNNNNNNVTNGDDDHNDEDHNVDTQQPTLWLDAFQAERGWVDCDNNDYVNDNEDELQKGQGQQSGGEGGFQI